jgi:uncharacterized SAM-binding protein YcdF (DUF218 family)
MYDIAKLAGYVLSPLTLAWALWLAAGAFALAGRRRIGMVLASVAFGGLWLASMPLTAAALLGPLERRYPMLPVDAAPAADAIVVLGGAVAVAMPPDRPTFGLTASSGRVWQAAALYRAGKAPRIVIAAGGVRESQGDQVEAEAIAQMLGLLGVPREALILEPDSRTTWENAANTLPHLERLGAQRVLLVTSARHMDRAMQTFARSWAARNPAAPVLLPFPTDPAVLSVGHFSLKGLLPTLGGLENVTAALKEYAGMIALAMI